jgi:hypothetical protein
MQGPPPGELVSVIGLGLPGDQQPDAGEPEVIACFYADRASAGHEHSEFGTVRQVTVTR